MRVSPAPTELRSRRRSSVTRGSSGVGLLLRQHTSSGSSMLTEARNAFDPNSRFIRVWLQLRLALILFELLVIPFLVAFHTDATRTQLLGVYVCELLFCADLYVQLNTGYYENGNVLRDASKARRKYLSSSAFVLDLLALVPLSLALPLSTTGAHSVALLEMHKLLRLWRLPALTSNLDDLYARHFALLKLTKVLGLTLLLSHFVACGRFGFGYDHGDHGERNHWLPLAPLASSTEAHSPRHQYLMSLFWAFGLLTGQYEGELPHANTEFAFTIVVSLCGFALFTALCATFFLLSKCESGDAELAEARVHQFQHILAFHRVPTHLHIQAVDYLQRYYTQAEANDREAARLLCPSISVDVQVGLLEDTVAQVPVFAGCDRLFVRAVARLLELVALPAHVALFRAGDHGDAMYIVHAGVLHTVVGGIKVRELRKGSFVGEVAVFARLPRTATVLTATYCTLYRLSRFHADKLLEGYPRCACLIKRTVAEMLQQNVAATAAANSGAASGTDRVLADDSTITAVSPPTKSDMSFVQLIRLKRVARAFVKRTSVQVRDGAARSMNASKRSSRGGSSRSLGGQLEGPLPEAKTPVVLQDPSNVLKSPEQPPDPGVGAVQPVVDSPSQSAPPLLEAQNVHSDGRQASRRRSHSMQRSFSHKVFPETTRSSFRDIVVPTQPVEGDQPPSQRRGSLHSSFLANGINKFAHLRDSFFHGGDGAVKPSDALKGFYEQFSHLSAAPPPRWWNRLLMRRGLDAESKERMAWIAVVTLACCYNWVVIPLLLSFPALAVLQARWYLVAPNFLADAVLWADIYVNMHLSFSVNSEKILDSARTAERYVSSGAFVLDLLFAWPYWIFSPSNFAHPAVRLPRLLAGYRLRGHFGEVEAFFRLHNRHRLMLFGILLLMLYHVVACLYFCTTYFDGFSSGEDKWLPSDDVFLQQVNATHFQTISGTILAADSHELRDMRAEQYFRALYYAANVLAAVGRMVEPARDTEYGAALVFMLSGFFITAIVVDNVQKNFTASAFEQKEFFAARTRIQRFLKRQNTPLPIHLRVNSFLDFWWSAHRGAIIDELLQQLPSTIKRDIVRSICTPAMDSLDLLCSATDAAVAATTVRPHECVQDQRSETLGSTVQEQMEELFLDNVKFVLYGQGEIIYRRGDYASGLFFLLEGQVSTMLDGEVPRHVPLGGFFGTASLQATLHDSNGDYASSATRENVGYEERVTAVSGCIVVYVSGEHLRAMQELFPSLAEGFCKLEQQLHVARVARSADLRALQPRAGLGTLGMRSPPTLRRALRPRQKTGLAEKLAKNVEWWQRGTSVDPDWPFVGYWEAGMLLASTLQGMLVVFYVCFGAEDSAGARAIADAIMVTLEVFFLVDVYLHLRLGVYEYGNKIMDLGVIRRRYLTSWHFVIDVAALVPLFILNWTLPSGHARLEVLNLNKLLRCLKASSQFQALETKHVKLTMELRILKLVYYTFLASHIFGCIWFDFAAHKSGVHIPLSSHTDDWSPAFGKTRWGPSAALGTAGRTLQYLSSVFWSYGLMSNSSPGELPKSVAECTFSVLTMTVGFFLFAYVVGHISDVIELQDSENRHFVAKLSSLRQLLRHFELPRGVEEKFKNYFFFKRFHSITQEHVLERVLPPSLLVDIRMFQLQPMIVKVAFLVGMEDSVTRMLVSLFTQVLFVKDEFVCHFGEEGSEMFFIYTGVLDIYIPSLAPSSVPTAAGAGAGVAANFPNAREGARVSASGLRKVNEITAGSYFGEAALFTNTPRNAYVKANTSCILYKLSRHSLELVFARYPEWQQKVLRIVKIQQQQQRLQRLAFEAQAPERVATGRRRGLKRAMSRIDVVNARAENIEQLLLSHRRATHATGSAPSQVRTWVFQLWQKTRATVFVVRWVLPVICWLHSFVKQLAQGAEIQSPFYLLWMRLVSFCAIYTAVMVPYRLTYDSLDRWNGIPVCLRIVEALCELVFWLDIWAQFHMRTSQEAMELYEQDQLLAYKRDRLALDVAAIFPLDHFGESFLVGSNSSLLRKCLRLNRCLKVANLVYYRNEITRRSVSYEVNRTQTLWLLYLLAMFWTSCAYFAVAIHDGFGSEWQNWLPSSALDTADPSPELLLLRLFRGFSFATTAFVKKSKTFVPSSTLNNAFSLLVSFGGQLIMALMIAEMANVFLLYIDNEVQFRKSHLTVERFLSRWKVSATLKQRADAFLTSWWSSHAGVDYQLIFEDLPASVRTEGIMAITKKPLGKFVDRVFRSLVCVESFHESCEDAVGADADGHDHLNEFQAANLTYAIAKCLRFEGYPRDENVIVEGSVCKAMYFVVRGYLLSKSASNPELYHAGRFRSGDYFGENGLLGHSVSLFTVTTIRACDLFVLSSEHLFEVLESHPYFHLVLAAAQHVVQQKQSTAEFLVESAEGDEKDQETDSDSDKDDREEGNQHRAAAASSVGSIGKEGGKDKEAMNKQRALQLKRLLHGSSQESKAMWEKTFAQFMELVVPKGTMNTAEGSISAGAGQEDVSLRAAVPTTSHGV
ncbi:hypothetical protein BBJ28_00008805 [Nothophytophthora sp. Chile5]|nr:hypothetical protein BBJ28_00008805 [Nothophytophthora sp. Chile5]